MNLQQEMIAHEIFQFEQNIRGIHTWDFSRKTTNAVLSDLQIIDVVK